MSTTLILGITAIAVLLGGGLILIGIFSVFRGSGRISQRLGTFVGNRADTSRRVRDLGDGIFATLRSQMRFYLRFLESDQINRVLMSANWDISGTEYYLIKYGGALVALIVGWLVARSPIPGLGLGLLVFLAPDVFLRRSRQKRQTQFENQMVDVLVMVRGAVRAGYSLLQALDVVVKEMAPPASEEFDIVQREVELGLPLRQALTNLALRMQNEDLNIVVAAININIETGGNLTEILQAVTETIRDRIRVLGEVRVLTSYARYSSYLLSLLPVIITGLLFLINPEYISRIFVPGPILIIPIVALIMLILGNIWLRLLGRIDV